MNTARHACPSSHPFHLQPLAAAVRYVLASGMMVGVLQARAAELPVPKANWTSGRATLETLGGKTMNIVQKENKITLNWKSFDIGAGKTVNFRQPGASAIALNNIDASGRPSQIFGALNANGQVYLVNPDGVIFGKTARVDVGALVATNLAISDSVLEKGLTKGGNVGSLADTYAALQGKGDVYLVNPSTGDFVLNEQGQKMKIRAVVDAGAVIKTKSGGRVIIAAPEVVNAGRIETPNGQTILVGATDKVYLQEDSQLRGLLVEVQTGGKVENLGSILARQGNVSLLGFAVNQSGRVSATTAVRTEGSVRLLAREGGGYINGANGIQLTAGTTKRNAAGEDGLGAAARVTLGKDSVTEVLPDLADKATAGTGEAQPKSRVEISAKQVHIQGGAKVTARSGQIDISATETPANPATPTNPQADTRVLVESGAVLDASGLKSVKKSVSDNFLTQEVRKNELRDAPEQRNGVLYAKTVRFDRRDAPTIVDVSGAMSRYREGIAERSTEGGTVNVRASGDVILQKNAKVDVSGGSLDYQGAWVGVTQLVDAGGRRVDIQDADPHARYTGLTSQVGYERGYVEGKNAGSVTIAAGRMALDGQLRAGTEAGVHQRKASGRPDGGSLTLDLLASTLSPRNIVVDRIKQEWSEGVGIDDPLPAAADELTLSADAIKSSAFQHLSLKTLGKVTLAEGATLSLPRLGSLSVDAAGLDVQGRIDIASGTVDAHAKRGTAGITLGSDAAIDVSGRWQNDRISPEATGALAVNGGKVNLEAAGDIRLTQGSRISANGGAWLDAANKLHEGKGGAISLTANGPNGSNLDLQGTLSAYGLHQGGSLSLETNGIDIGNAAPADDGAALRPLWLAPDFFGQGGFQSYRLTANLGDAVIHGGTRLDLKAVNWRLSGQAAATASQRSLAGMTNVASLPEAERGAVDFTLALQQLPSRVSAERSVIVEQGASIHAETGAKIGFSSDTRVLFDGSVNAPAGQINLGTVRPTSNDDFLGFRADTGVFLGSHAVLSARGAAEIRATGAAGPRQLDVYDGGRVSLSAQQGFVVAGTGARIDVSGISDQYDVRLSSGGVTRQTVATAGGSINLSAPEGILLDATLEAKGGNRTRPGGSLTVNLDANLRQDRRSDAEIRREGQTVYKAASSVMRVIGFDGGVMPDGWVPGQDLPPAIFREARVAARRIDDGDFADVTLRTYTPDQLSGRSRALDEIRFEGNVDLSSSHRLALSTPILSWAAQPGQAEGSVNLKSAYVSLGSDLSRQAPVVPQLGNGQLTVSADLIDLVGGTSLTGYQQVALNSQGDIRGIGIRADATQRDFLGELRTAADLTLKADQVYPTTLSQFTFGVTRAGGRIDVERNGAATPGAPLSAAGRLTLEAETIRQAGVLRAPFGVIELRKGTDAGGNPIAADTLELAAGSLTSVSGKGLNVPFGRTAEGGRQWLYPLFNSDQNLTVAGTPEKQVILNGQSIDLAAGARVDFSGGGDLSAYEFAGNGPGGSYDAVAPDQPNVPAASRSPFETKFAILPKMQGYAPYDPLEFPLAETYGLSMGKTVHLSGVPGLPEGDYVLLPARYALLPGAYLVTPVAGANGMLAGEVRQRADGTPIAAGYYGFAGQGESVSSGYWQGFAVQSGSYLRQQSELVQTRASDFFGPKGRNSGSPDDAGQLVLTPTERLALAGALDSAAAVTSARAGRVDIAADVLNVVNQRSDSAAPGVVELLAGDLDNLKSGSLLLGGVRQTTANGTEIRTLSRDVTVTGGTSLEGPETLLVANRKISVQDGAAVVAKGSVSGEGETLMLNNGAAFLRVSSGEVAQVGRTNASNGGASLEVAAGATIKTGGSVNIDTTGDTRLLGTVDMAGGSLGLGASQVNIGEVPAGTSGLNISNDLLNSFQAESLFLRSSHDIRLYGAAALEVNDTLQISAPGLAGYGNAGDVARLTAGSRLVLSNLDGATDSAVAPGTGTLILGADDVVLGPGAFTGEGFGSTQLSAAHSLRGIGESRFAFQGDVTMSTPLVVSEHGATTEVTASGALALNGNGAAADAAVVRGWGGRWDFRGDTLRQGARIELPSGAVSFQARGNVDLLTGSVTDVSAGKLSYFGGRLVPVSGGTVSIGSSAGDISLAEGARVSLAGLDGKTSAGTLHIDTPQGRFLWNGTVEAGAGGSFGLDAVDLGAGGFSGLYAKIEAAGFDDRIDLRQRQGDVAVTGGAADGPVKARYLGVTADAGNISISGHFDLSGKDGGEAQFWAGKSLTVESSAAIDASAGDANGRGGKLTLAAGEGGFLDAKAGAVFDVSGGQGGEVRFRAYRNAQDVTAVTDIAARIVGAESVTLEAARAVQADAPDIATWRVQTDQFMAAAAGALENRLTSTVSVVPGLEVRSNGSFTLAENWDLLGWRYGGKAGVLTLRAAGDLNIGGLLSDGFGVGYVPDAAATAGNRINNYLQAGESWAFRLVGGADLGGANLLSTAGQGNVTVGKGTVVRTGTGDIEVAAAGDIRLSDSTSAIYTAGRPDADRYGKLDSNTLQRVWYGEFPVGGGDISLIAGTDIIGAATPQLVTNWQARLGNFGSVAEDHPAFIKRYPTAWGIVFDESQTMRTNTRVGAAGNVGFQENVGALGGGNVRVASGGSIRDLSVMLPTTGKPVGEVDPVTGEFRTNEVEVNGGGNLSVDAGKDILGGVFFVDRGDASVKAGGAIKGGSQYASGPLFALGDGTFDVRARQTVQVGAVFDPSWIPGVASANPSYFSRYSPASEVRFTAASGDLVFANDVERIKAQYQRVDAQGRSAGPVISTQFNDFALRTYPGTLKGYSASGDLVVERSMTLFPSAQGGLELVAGGNVASAALGQVGSFVTLSDADPGLLPDAAAPISAVDALQALNQMLDPNPAQQVNGHALSPVHAGDDQPAIIAALGGDLRGATQGHDPLQFTIPKPTMASAAGDIVGVSFKLQHDRENQVSVIQAGGDIRFETLRNPLTGALVISDQRIEVAGPGRLQVMAGGSVDLGTSNGILSIGNLENPSLAGSGASLDVFAALPKGLAQEAFINQYLVDGNFYRLDLALYLADRFGSLIEQAHPGFGAALNGSDGAARDQALQDAVSFFKALPTEQRVDFCLRMLFSEIRLSSVAAAVRAGQLSYAAALERLQTADRKQGMDGSAARSPLTPQGAQVLADRLRAIVDNPSKTSSGYESAEAAIAALFPEGSVGKGDIRMFYSTIQTLAGGNDNEAAALATGSSAGMSLNDSDINLVTPGGLINLGLAAGNGSVRPPDQLGVIIKRDGSANAFMDGDFLVNRARFVANGGGDVSVYSRNANIDAGLGSNSAFAVQQKISSFDNEGMYHLEYLPSVSGSGIQANAPEGERKGNVFLGVPRGKVFISEAGISGDSIVAPALVGNQAFVSTSVSGGSSGAAPSVPTDVGSVASNAARSAQDAASNNGNDKDQAAAREKAANVTASILNVDVVGYGNCSVSDVRDGKEGCGGGNKEGG